MVFFISVKSEIKFDKDFDVLFNNYLCLGLFHRNKGFAINKTDISMKIMKKSSCDYQVPTVVVMETVLEGVLCLGKLDSNSTMEGVDREEFEW